MAARLTGSLSNGLTNSARGIGYLKPSLSSLPLSLSLTQLQLQLQLQAHSNMVHSSSTSSALVALLALSTVLSDSATALPTHRSSSAITRRAHIASHLDAPASLDKRTNLGDHSVYVDASTSQPGGTGGVRNSTINLTVVSKRDSTLSSFSRVVRSFFRRSSVQTSSSSTSPSSAPQLVALPQHTAAPYTKGHRTSRRQHQAAAALSRRKHSKRSLPDHPAPRIGVVVPPRPKNAKRSKLAERQNYEAGNEQASIYAAAVAALDTASAPSPQVTAQPIALNANAYDSSLLSSSVIDSPASLPPITVTMTLVPSGSNGAYIDVAAIPTSTLSSDSLPLLSTSTLSISTAGDALDATPIATTLSTTPTTLAQKLRHRRSTYAERQKGHGHFIPLPSSTTTLTTESRKEEEDTSRLKRSINPKTGSFPTQTLKQKTTATRPPASQEEEEVVEPPKWTAIAHF